jgi:hypothetical protein
VAEHVTALAVFHTIRAAGAAHQAGDVSDRNR